ncbi:MAG: dihydropteroate synthase [Bacteroidetes bacterium OLB11]|nr:MAG: dihydropteroate synthase [Bacteroidetes bacterium OLB11]
MGKFTDKKQQPFSINCKGRLLIINKPIVMGIINATPDSLYNQGKNSSLSEILMLSEKMIQDGAKIIDVGGMSTRPGAEEISEDEECKRVIPIVSSLKKQFPESFISIDTYRSRVAKEAILAGADIVNDISAGDEDNNIISVCTKFQTPYIAMHKQGTPRMMQVNPQYENVTLDIFDYFSKHIAHFKQKNLHDVILDVGFGFGKTIAHNYQLLKQLAFFKQLQKPILVGISRKSMIAKPLQIQPQDALNGTSALHFMALQNGANILRVHDVKEAMQCITLHGYYQNAPDF